MRGAEGGAGERGYRQHKETLRRLSAAVDEYLDANASDAVAEESWKKRMSRDLAEFARRSERLGITGLAAVEAKLEGLAAQQAQLVERLAKMGGPSTVQRL